MMTPVELNIYARAYAARHKDEQRLTQANMYSHAALMRSMIWSKHPPSFERVFADSQPRQTEQMTDEQLFAMVQSLNALYGGEEVNEWAL